jgi:hypothetical protein
MSNLSKRELVHFDFKGYWEKKGWSDEAVIPVESQILMAMEGKKIPLGNYVIGGMAYGGRCAYALMGWQSRKSPMDPSLSLQTCGSQTRLLSHANRKAKGVGRVLNFY